MLTSLLVCLLAQDETVFYKFPAGAKEPEVQRTIKALSARIEDSKFDGLKVLPLKRGDLWALGVHSKGKIGENLLAAIEDLTAIQASKIEVHVKRELNAQELDLYKPGETAPAGCVWRLWNGTHCLFEKATVDISPGLRWVEGDKTQQHPYIAPGTPYLELSVACSAKLNKPEILTKAAFSIDGNFVNGAMEYHPPAEIGKGMRITGTAFRNKALGICINHPLVLDLKKSD